jgi:hypothetical protein
MKIKEIALLKMEEVDFTEEIRKRMEEKETRYKFKWIGLPAFIPEETLDKAAVIESHKFNTENMYLVDWTADSDVFIDRILDRIYDMILGRENFDPLIHSEYDRETVLSEYVFYFLQVLITTINRMEIRNAICRYVAIPKNIETEDK